MADVQTKPFKGVISNWYRDGEVIIGRCLFHLDMHDHVTVQAIMENAPVRFKDMHTSSVEHLHEMGNFILCETRNSFYALIEPRTDIT